MITYGPAQAKVKKQMLEQWHKFTPWFPRRVGDARVMFQTIQRKGTLESSYEGFAFWVWEYKMVDGELPVIPDSAFNKIKIELTPLATYERLKQNEN